MRCSNCREVVEDGFDACWKCGTPISAAAAPSAVDSAPTTPEKVATPAGVLEFRSFRGVLDSWESLFGQAADFATGIGRHNVLSISHSADQHDGVVTVWYWTDTSAPDA